MLLPKLAPLFKQSQLLYSLLLVILIPVALVFNTLWALRSFDRDFNLQLRQEAVLVGTVLGNLSADKLATVDSLAIQLQKIKTDQPQIRDITILQSQAGKLEVIVSTIAGSSLVSDPTLGELALSSGKAHAALINYPLTNEKVWSVISPIKDDLGQVIALVDTKISPQEIETVMSRTTRDSLLVLGVTILIVLLLLINHLRFFEYVSLFRRLKEVDKMKDDFISMASHELRTPLTAIAGFSDLLIRNEKIAGDEKAKHYAETIKEATLRLSELVEDILNVSRIEQNRLLIDMKDTSLDKVINQVIDQLKVQANQKGLTLITNLLVPQPVILADDNRLKQIFVNLIGNAIKYTNKGGVTINQKINGKMIETFIEDTGLGMSPENREHLFEEFYRIRTEETRNISGTGLGLWITKKIVEKMNGKIFVDSIEGKGSRFTIVFPLKD